MKLKNRITRNDISMLSCFFVSNNFDSKLHAIIEEMNRMYDNAEDYALKTKIDAAISHLNKGLNSLIAIRNIEKTIN